MIRRRRPLFDTFQVRVPGSTVTESGAQMNWRLACVRLLGLLSLLLPVTALHADDDPPAFRSSGPVRFFDDPTDAVIRRTDSCGAQAVCGSDSLPTDTVIPELRWTRIGRWAPTAPSTSVYLGAFSNTGGFLRVDVVFAGLVNPPGPVVNSYNPRLYGPNPVFGFLELDVDANVDTGGEVDEPMLRYAGNAARFGGRPVGARFSNRISIDGRDPDNVASTVPWVERSGADFELELRGDEIVTVLHVVGDDDNQFEALETWDLRGRFFRRARGYDECAGGPYAPRVWLRFSNCDISLSPVCGAPVQLAESTSSTTVTFVYPLDNEAYAAANSVAVEGYDVHDFNGNSVLEALLILEQAAVIELCPATYEWSPLISAWQNQTAGAYLDPFLWRTTMLWGTARMLSVAAEGNYIWTDINPNVVPGDFNGDGLPTATDARLAAQFVAQRDGLSTHDADQTSNGVIQLPNFGLWFSIFDVDYDGFVGPDDVSFSQQAPYDYDNDGNVDLADYAAFQVCCGNGIVGAIPSTACTDAFDYDQNGTVQSNDYTEFATQMTGP